MNRRVQDDVESGAGGEPGRDGGAGSPSARARLMASLEEAARLTGVDPAAVLRETDQLLEVLREQRKAKRLEAGRLEAERLETDAPDGDGGGR